MMRKRVAGFLVGLVVLLGVASLLLLRPRPPSVSEFRPFAERFARQANLKLVSVDVKRSDSVIRPYVCEGVYHDEQERDGQLVGEQRVVLDFAKDDGRWVIVGGSRTPEFPSHDPAQAIQPDWYAGPLKYAQP